MVARADYAIVRIELGLDEVSTHERDAELAECKAECDETLAEKPRLPRCEDELWYCQ